jgi:thiamine-phosphate pyrophosphorylase
MLRYAITDRIQFAGNEAAREEMLVRRAARWAEVGIDFVQLREKDLEAEAVASLARRMLAVLRAHAPAPRLLINSRAGVGVAIGADGVHLTSAPGMPMAAEIRRLYAAAGLPEPIVSVSCHSLDEVARARDSGADLILFGPVFEKRIGDQLISAGAGLSLLHAACVAAGSTPVLALGGVTQGNTAACLRAGAAGIAAIRLFLG